MVVFVNPRSRANRRDPRLAARLAEVLGAEGRVAAPASLDELASTARELAADPPAVVGVHGGDGTLHRTIVALLRAFTAREVRSAFTIPGPEPQDPMPAIAILPGGTMNVVASSLGINARPERLLAEVVSELRAGRAVRTLARRCLRVGDSFGFVFGNGLMANFLEEYYAGAGYGPRRAVWILSRTLLSALVRGRYAGRIFRRFHGKVWVDGQPLPWTRLTGVGAATVREVGLGFKLNHRADEDPDRFAVLAIHAGPVALAADLVPVHQGKGIAPRRAWSALAQTLRIEPAHQGTSYTIDGDLYRAEGPIEVGLGPSLRIVEPLGRRALVPTGR